MENLLERSSSRCWDCAWLNVFLTLCLLASLFIAIYINPRVFIASGVCYLIIICETCCSLTRSFLGNVMPPGQLTQYLVSLGALPPHIKYWIQNYHYETRTRTVNGKTRTERVRVNTHQATEYYAWGDCVDKSPEPDSVEIIKNFKLTRVTNGLNVSYTPDAWASFAYQEEDFKKRNIRDTEWDYRVINEIPGHIGEILLHNMPDGLPWYANPTYYWLFTFAGMGWLYRILFLLNSQKVTFDFAKIILK